MKRFNLVFSIFFLWTCGGGGGGSSPTEPEVPPIVINLTSLTGQAQKGPFNNGTAINVAELNSTLSPTGRNFSSAITDNTGKFAVANVQLESPYVELRANGYYFNEVSNEISSGQLTLYALSNLTGKTSLNVNIITHLEKNRMTTLMSGDNPQTFAQAKNNAQEEVFAIFDYSRANVPESELLDISQGGAANAKLLAMSAILQGNLTVGQMSELLANISTDIAADGTLDDASLRATLIDNSKNLDMAAVRSNLQARYTSLGITATIPDFETEINQFLKPPVSQDMSASTAEDTAINITLAGSDPEGESLTYTILEVNNATVTLSGNVANYAPNTNFNGTDTFTYKANDGTSDSNVATVTMTVSAEDDEPNTIDVATTTDEDVAVTVNLSADEYDGDSYSFAIIADVSNGATSLNGSVVTYTPNQDWNGTDTFTFEATDDTGRTINVATATITVNAVNDAPVANDITNQVTDENRMMQLDITLVATDVDGDALTYSFSSASNGTLSLNNDIVTYVPNQDWNGEDTFTYTANDGSLDSNAATVTITVNSVDDAPVIIPAANNGTTTMNEDGFIYEQFTATDVDGDDVTLSIVTNPSNGTITDFTNDDPDCPGNCASFIYTPTTNWYGTDTFTYKANDGTLDSAIETHTFIVNSVNDIPIMTTQTITIDEDVPTDITLSATDADGDNLTYRILTVDNGSTSISGSTVTYTPPANLNGANADIIFWGVNDGTSDGINSESGASESKVFISINAVNDAPVSSAVSASTSEDIAKTVTLDATDLEGDALTYSIVSNPSKGSLGSVSGTDVVYTPNANWNGIDTFTYKANDGALDSNTSTVTIDIANVGGEINFLNATNDDVGNNSVHRTEDAYTLKWNYTGGGTSETYNIYLNHYEGQSQWGVGTFSRLIATVDPQVSRYDGTFDSDLYYHGEYYFMIIDADESIRNPDESTLSTFNVLPKDAYATMVYPNGGEDLVIGSTYTIRYDISDNVNYLPPDYVQTGYNPGVELHLYKKDIFGHLGEIDGVRNYLNNGEYQWNITNVYDPGTYLIQIRAMGHIYDLTDDTFTIIEPPAVTYPNGGETFALGQTVNIEWTGNWPSTNIDLYKDGSKVQAIATAMTGGGNEWAWDNIDAAVGSGYKIRVYPSPTSDQAGDGEDFSDASFSIEAGVTVITPNGGETLTVGQDYTISWSSNLETQGSGTNIELWKNDSKQGDIVTNITAGITSYTWNVSDNPGDGFKVFIGKVDDNAAGNDFSDTTFQIAN